MKIVQRGAGKEGGSAQQDVYYYFKHRNKALRSRPEVERFLVNESRNATPSTTPIANAPASAGSNSLGLGASPVETGSSDMFVSGSGPGGAASRAGFGVSPARGSNGQSGLALTLASPTSLGAATPGGGESRRAVTSVTSLTGFLTSLLKDAEGKQKAESMLDDDDDEEEEEEEEEQDDEDDEEEEEEEEEEDMDLEETGRGRGKKNGKKSSGGSKSSKGGKGSKGASASFESLQHFAAVLSEKDLSKLQREVVGCTRLASVSTPLMKSLLGFLNAHIVEALQVNAGILKPDA